MYADWTASGRALEQVESYVERSVLPWYANTHTETSITGAATTTLRENARKVIFKAVHCNEKDVVLFTGNGTTDAVNDFVALIELEKHCKNRRRKDVPLILTSGYEHHSNLLPWRELGAEVLTIQESATTGAVDLVDMERVLSKHRYRSVVIGSFSAGSNVTGICSDVKAIAVLMHKYGRLACFDYACVGPYLDISMNWTPENDEDAQHAYLDAVFVSAHKFAGGVGATGLLIAKRATLTRHIPVCPGGGTVLYVTGTKQAYLNDVIYRTEAGTPNIVGSIRAGLAFQIKNLVGVANIIHREKLIESKVRSAVGAHPNVALLGPPPDLTGAHRIPIMSFLIRCGKRFLHHSFVAAVMNDVYGIQTRSGCMCAGPYALRLLGYSKTEIDELMSFLPMHFYMKPGFTRLSLVYFNTEEDVDFVIAALLEVATHAWKLLPQYLFDAPSGTWQHRSRTPGVLPNLVSNFDMVSSEAAASLSPQHVLINPVCDAASVKEYYQAVLAKSREIYASAHALYQDPQYGAEDSDYEAQLYTGSKKPYSWFVFPKEVLACARAQVSSTESEWTVPEYGGEDVLVRPEKYWTNLKLSQTDSTDKAKRTVEQISFSQCSFIWW
jgi:selenocysteine lyase/cysteine desulfurase